MPELPEVENIRRTLQKQLVKNDYIVNIRWSQSPLRFPIPKKKLKALKKLPFHGISRRGKYLLWHFDHHTLISHLGMTGQWRQQNFPAKFNIVKSPDHKNNKCHDHVDIELASGLHLVYNDPRRFGYIDVVENDSKLSNHPFLCHLGYEPLDPELNSSYLFENAQNSQRAVKIYLMDQEIVVGVGNIYASEVLFDAGILPFRPAKSLSKIEWQNVVKAIRRVLQKAIALGGSTIRDYRNADGAQGKFQSCHRVYGRKGKACHKCGNPIQASVLGGRATYWCQSCQK